MRRDTVLLTGATGFVGTSLYPALCAAGYRVRCATRDPAAAERRQPGRNYARFELADAESMREALHGCQRAVYLIHGMAGSDDYVERERSGALAFRSAAEDAGVERVVYLGGMRPRGPASRHLESRLRTGEILRAGHTPTIELQASMIIGAGSESFRMVRDLAARLPAMILPAWSRTRTQPVAVADVTAALVHALNEPREVTGAFALPGPETLSAREILQRTARLLGHDPRMIGVPFVTPKLSAYWIRWITRADPHIAEELVQGLRIDILHHGPGYWVRMPDHHLTGFDQAVQAALSREAGSLDARGRVLEQVIDRLSPKLPPRDAKRSR